MVGSLYQCYIGHCRLSDMCMVYTFQELPLLLSSGGGCHSTDRYVFCCLLNSYFIFIHSMCSDSTADAYTSNFNYQNEQHQTSLIIVLKESDNCLYKQRCNDFTVSERHHIKYEHYQHNFPRIKTELRHIHKSDITVNRQLKIECHKYKNAVIMIKLRKYNCYV